MCGIAGVWDFTGNTHESVIKQMCSVLKHRGPDDTGIFSDTKRGVFLGHQRLAVIDLTSAAHQPMRKGDHVLSYNGEIYNFEDIRDELTRENVTFSSNSDTEVLLAAYEKWGIMESLKRLRGMFAFAMWDERKTSLVLCRDRLGVKPLYYYFDGSTFVFASEIKAILTHPQVKKEIDMDALARFLQLGYIPAPLSIFKHIRKLEPGHILTLDAHGEQLVTPYWDVADYYASPMSGCDETAATHQLRTLLEEASTLRLVSDVPVGVFLSGGIDSSLLTALLQKNTSKPVQTFTIGFSGTSRDEAIHARVVADYLKTDHHELQCTPERAREIVPKLPEIYGEPFADPSAIPTYLLSSFARESVKVALSADGGDELFCGYTRYPRAQRVHSFAMRFPEVAKPVTIASLRALERIVGNRAEKARLALENSGDLAEIYGIMRRYYSDAEIRELLGEDLSVFTPRARGASDVLSQLQEIDTMTYLPDDILTKTDRASMAVGLEVREPFLDHKLVEFAASLPIEAKYNNGQAKYLLKKILFEEVPRELVDRPKQGFGVPLDKWLKDEMRPLLDRYTNEEDLKKEGILDPTFVAEEKQQFLKGKRTFNRIWNVIMFRMWKEHFEL